MKIRLKPTFTSMTAPVLARKMWDKNENLIPVMRHQILIPRHAHHFLLHLQGNVAYWVRRGVKLSLSELP